jgi:hypothetical protein
MRLTAEKRNELNREAHTKAIRVAIHDVGIFIGVLFAADKLVEIGSRSPVALTALIDKLVEIWSQPPAKIALLAPIIAGALIFIAVCFFAHLSLGRFRDRKSMERLLDDRDEAESVTDTDNG